MAEDPKPLEGIILNPGEDGALVTIENRDYREPCDTCKHQKTDINEYPCVFCSRMPELHKI
jgi:hypothetical protein